MFEKLYRAIQDVLPHKGFALVITMSTLGGATFLPYLADRMIDDYDELRYEYMIQRDRIRLLQLENDSLQDELRAQSIEFSKLLYSATTDFNKKIIEIQRKKHPAIKTPERVITYKSDKHIPDINRFKPNYTLFDSSEIHITEASGIEFIPMSKPLVNKSDTIKTRIRAKRKYNPTASILEFVKSNKSKQVFNPDRKR